MLTRNLQHSGQAVTVFGGVHKINMKRWQSPIIALAIGTVLCAATPTNAQMTTYHVSFTANSFQIGSGPDAPPVDPVVGDFNVTLDPTVSVVNQTAGITLNSLNIALGSTLSFTYNPVAEGVFPPGSIRVGGLFFGSDVVQFSPSTDDFWLQIDSLTTTPAFRQMGYSQTSVSNDNLFFTLNRTGTVSVTIVPAPATAISFGLLISLAASRRRRLVV